jgi:enoyl-CoA hydratase
VDFVDGEERVPGVVVATLKPPAGDFGEVLHPLHAEVMSTIERIRGDDAIRAAVLTGVDQTFYAGPPLSSLYAAIRTGPEAVDEVIAHARRIVAAFMTCDKPIVAAVNGKAIGLGCQLAFLSDFCFAVPDATFQDTHVRVGLPAGDGGVLIYPLLFGLARAKRYLLTGERLDAQTAVEAGAVERIVDPGELMDVAVGRAQRLTGANYEAVRATKAALHRYAAAASSAAFDYALQAEKAAMRDERTHAIMQRLIGS